MPRTLFRHPVETIGRLVGFGALTLALLLSWRATAIPAADATRTLSAGALADSTGQRAAAELSRLFVAMGQRDATEREDDELLRGSSGGSPDIHLTLSNVPTSALRATVFAASLAGASIGWTDSTAARGLAVSANAAADPQGGTIVRARAQESGPLTVRDAASTLDSTRDGLRGITVSGARLAGPVEARMGRSRALLDVPPPALLRRVLLFARPGWEAKFVTAALEERGWKVDGRLLIGRSAFVTTGAPSVADTARYSAAIVLDSGVTTAAQLARFVRQGGGVVLGGDALRGGALRVLQPAVPAGERPMVPGALLTDAPRQGLDAWELRAQPRAVVLAEESHGTHADPTVVVWRIGSGRVAASAYRETWRWRMEGRADGILAHRAWWSALVTAVAFVPPATGRGNEERTGAEYGAPYPGDAAPYADLVARIGVPSPVPASRLDAAVSPGERWPATWLLYVVAAVALLMEWTARRRRGAA